MTKCDFCVRFGPKDGCYWEGLDSSLRKSDCEIAIQRMEKALASIGTAVQPIL